MLALNHSCMLLECLCSPYSVIVHAHVYMFSAVMDTSLSYAEPINGSLKQGAGLILTVQYAQVIVGLAICEMCLVMQGIADPPCSCAQQTCHVTK